MDPMLIDADDKHRAADASLRSPYFRRMLSYAWPHRKLLAIGMVASVVYGLLNSVGILGALPVLTILISPEGLHGSIYREAAEDRMQVKIDARYNADGDPLKLDTATLLQYKSAAARRAFGDIPVRLIAVQGKPADSIEAFRTITTADGPINIQFAVSDGPVRAATIELGALSFKNRFQVWLARWIPPSRTRGDQVKTLSYVLVAVALLVVAGNIARFVAQYFVASAVLRSVMDLRRVLYRKILRLPMDFFATSTSDLVTRFVQDAQEIQRGLLSLFGKLVREPIKAAFILAVALAVNAQLTVTMLIVAPIVVLIFWSVGKKIRKANKRLLRTYGEMIGGLGTTLAAIGVVKAYNAENAERKRLWQIDRRMFTHQLRIARLEAILNPTLEVLAVVAIGIVTVWLGSQVINQSLRIEEFGTVLFALAMLMDPLRKFADVYPRVMRSAAGAQRIFSVVDAPEEAELSEGAVKLSPISDAIEFDEVVYSYPNAPSPALCDVSLTIRCGERVAIVGPNGSGKTTLTKLLLRFHDPQIGAIRIDGVDIRNAELSSLRRQFSLVTQDPVVFAMTVAENIVYGSRNGEAEHVVDAARRARAESFINEKPGRFDLMLDERGGNLSGGQRQRICIARAIMRNAPILIFDEATSQVDSESEQQIQEAIREFTHDRTTIMIAHRLSTIRFATRIVVMDRGRIIDTGSHEELFERCELYATLCRTQLAEADTDRPTSTA